MNSITRSSILFSLVCILLMFGFASAQRRDHLTNEEIELVRDVQDVDHRMQLFVRAIERRLLTLDGSDKVSAAEKKSLEKEMDKWGELPKGTKSELLSDIEKILDEAIIKLEDVFEREPENELIPFALYIIADFSEILIPRLRVLAEQTDNQREIGLMEKSAAHCNSILAARENVPRPTGKRKKKKITN